MPCEMEICIHKQKSLCPHPAITECASCRAQLCSAHIVECETCDVFFCRDCIGGHARAHAEEEARLRARAF